MEEQGDKTERSLAEESCRYMATWNMETVLRKPIARRVSLCAQGDRASTPGFSDMEKPHLYTEPSVPVLCCSI
jgi:saccharopine dehydrogenase-like NADP-dependent oxidoreductase